jgi:hypothetical protein
MYGVFGTLTGRGLAVMSSPDNARLRVVLAVLAILIVLGVLGLAFATSTHPHLIAPLASGQAWTEMG